MALEMYLRVDGVTGASRNYQHRGWAEVSSWGWSLTREPAAGQAGADAAANMNEIFVSKTIGTDSVALMQLFAEGTLIKEAELSIVPAAAKRGAQQKYLELNMKDVIIKSITTGGNDEESFFKEDIVLVFGKVQYTYHQYADIGTDGKSGAAQSFSFGWDLGRGQSMPVVPRPPAAAG